LPPVGRQSTAGVQQRQGAVTHGEIQCAGALPRCTRVRCAYLQHLDHLGYLLPHELVVDGDQVGGFVGPELNLNLRTHVLPALEGLRKVNRRSA
jgi:hypothetical protein